MAFVLMGCVGFCAGGEMRNPEKERIYISATDEKGMSEVSMGENEERVFYFRSRMDGTRQPFRVRTPAGYERGRRWPTLVVLHGYGDGPIVAPGVKGMLQIGPYGRGNLWYEGLGEKDVLECIAICRTMFEVDEDRMYLCGFSMGAVGTFGLGLTYPDLWAGCVPVCGRCKGFGKIENGRNVPFWIHAGANDTVMDAKESYRAYQKGLERMCSGWRYTEHPKMGHSFWINWEEVEAWLLAKERVRRPAEVSYCTEVPGRAYWVGIECLGGESREGRISVRAEGQELDIETDNVERYEIFLEESPVNLQMPIVIRENSREIYRGEVPERMRIPLNQ